MPKAMTKPIQEFRQAFFKAMEVGRAWATARRKLLGLATNLTSKQFRDLWDSELEAAAIETYKRYPGSEEMVSVGGRAKKMAPRWNGNVVQFKTSLLQRTKDYEPRSPKRKSPESHHVGCLSDSLDVVNIKIMSSGHIDSEGILYGLRNLLIRVPQEIWLSKLVENIEYLNRHKQANLKQIKAVKE